jgi:hypothetical protein
MALKKTMINYIFTHLRGAAELLRLRFQNAVEYFDFSAEGYWKSFLAIFVPVSVLILVMSVFNVGGGLSTKLSMAQIVFHILYLPFFAFVMIYFTRWLKIDRYYTPMIIIYNWYWGVMIALMVGIQVILVHFMGLESAGGIIIIFSVYLKIYVQWYILKNSLKIKTPLAIGVTIFSLLLSMVFYVVILKLIASDDIAKIQQQVETSMENSSAPKINSQ